MANNRDKTIVDLPKEIFTDAMPQANVPESQVTSVIGTLSRTGNHFHRMFKKELTKRAMRTLYQGIIDDDRETVKRILVARPDLLLVEPPKGLVIESKLTWQKFYAEKPAIMAAKRKQIKMLELIDELEQTEDVKQAKVEALLAWSPYETQQNAEGENEIVIPEKYATYAKSLIDVFSKETFPNGSDKYGDGMLSKETESVLLTLFNRLLPEQAVKLDDYLDVELLLLAVYKAYWDHFNIFKNWEQRDAFCIRVRGLIQSVLTPETAKIFCESLDDMVRAMMNGEKKEISKAAMAHKLKSGEAFYRTSRDSKEGAGFNFYCGIYAAAVGPQHAAAAGARLAGAGLDYLCQAKTTDLRNLCSRAQNRKQVRA